MFHLKQPCIFQSINHSSVHGRIKVQQPPRGAHDLAFYYLYTGYPFAQLYDYASLLAKLLHRSPIALVRGREPESRVFLTKVNCLFVCIVFVVSIYIASYPLPAFVLMLVMYRFHFMLATGNACPNSCRTLQNKCRKGFLRTISSHTAEVASSSGTRLRPATHDTHMAGKPQS
jgi:hypothetical protein